MAKSEVYSWRVSPETKAVLEDAARRERASVAGLLERIVRDWLGATRGRSDEDEAEQMRWRRAAARSFGRLRGGNARRAEQAGSAVRARLVERRAR